MLKVYAEHSSTPEVMVLRQGQIAAFDRDALGRRMRQHLARIASMQRARYSFASGTVAHAAGSSSRMVSLAAWARQHFEAQLDATRAQALVARFTGLLLSIAPDSVPATSICDATDLRILDALSTPIRLDHLWHQARTPRFRLLAFLHFLSCVGALELSGDFARAAQTPARAPRKDSDRQARRLLGVPVDADRSAVKRAYRKLARELHPDLHPYASERHRRHLERRLAVVTEAYSELSS